MSLNQMLQSKNHKNRNLTILKESPFLISRSKLRRSRYFDSRKFSSAEVISIGRASRPGSAEIISGDHRGRPNSAKVISAELKICRQQDSRVVWPDAINIVQSKNHKNRKSTIFKQPSFLISRSTFLFFLQNTLDGHIL